MIDSLTILVMGINKTSKTFFSGRDPWAKYYQMRINGLTYVCSEVLDVKKLKSYLYSLDQPFSETAVDCLYTAEYEMY